LLLLKRYWKIIREIQPDGLIISDPGILRLIKQVLPKIPIHLSTQANVTNKEAAKFWFEQGVKRIILARELSLKEIKEIKKAVPQLELEVFGHGAMCMAYSGRCILSKWMTGRSANLGDCAQPCRWKYFLLEKKGRKEKEKMKQKFLKEEFKKILLQDDQKRFEVAVEENQQGTYLFNSYDVCLIDQLDKLIRAGVSAIKIEGRNKSVYYAAVTARAYQQTLKSSIKFLTGKISKKAYQKIIEKQRKELATLSHRGYWTGFLLGDEPPHLLKQAYQRPPWLFVGVSCREDQDSTKRKVFVHNALQTGDVVTLFQPNKNIEAKIKTIKNARQENIPIAHGGKGEHYLIEFNRKIKGRFLIRKQVKGSGEEKIIV
jgi:putative protease